MVKVVHLCAFLKHSNKNGVNIMADTPEIIQEKEYILQNPNNEGGYGLFAGVLLLILFVLLLIYFILPVFSNPAVFTGLNINAPDKIHVNAN